MNTKLLNYDHGSRELTIDETRVVETAKKRLLASLRSKDSDSADRMTTVLTGVAKKKPKSSGGRFVVSEKVAAKHGVNVTAEISRRQAK